MISASSLVRVARCPGSQSLPHIGTSSEWTDAGTERHAVMERAVLAGDFSVLPEHIRQIIPPGAGLMPEQAIAYDTATGRARLLDVSGREYGTTATEIPGRIDLLVVMRGRAIVIDYKGRKSVGRPSRNHQLMLYALAVARLLAIDEVTIAVAYIADGSEEAPCSIETVDVLALDAFASTLPGILAAVEEQKRRAIPDVNQGDWCRHCPARQHCPGTVALARRILDVDQQRAWHLTKPLNADEAARLYEMRAQARAFLADVDSAITAVVLGEPGERIKLPSGKWYGRRTSTVEKLDADIALDVVQRFTDPDTADDVVETATTKSAIDEAVKAWAKRSGQKAAPMLRAIYEAIRAEGGSKTIERSTLSEYADKAESEAA